MTQVAAPADQLNAALTYASSQIGDPYLWGGDSPSGFDCSGLVGAAYKAAGIALPRTSQAQYDATAKVVGTPMPGDLVFFGSSPAAIHHVGIYVGGGQMIDAPHTGATVRVDKVYSDVVGYTRPLAGGVATTSSPLAGNSGGGVDMAGLSIPGLGGVTADVRKIVIEGLFVLGGVALLGLAVYRGAHR